MKGKGNMRKEFNERFKNPITANNDFIFVKTTLANGIARIPVMDLIYIKSNGNCVEIHAKNCDVLHPTISLKQTAQVLAKVGVIPISRTLAINKHKITTFGFLYVVVGKERLDIQHNLWDNFLNEIGVLGMKSDMAE